MARLRRWTRELLILLLLVLGVTFAMDWWRAPQAPLTFDQHMLETLDGEPVSLAQLSQDKPLLVYFWASWCGVCRAMQSTVMAVANDTPIITVAMQSGDVATVSEYMSRRQFDVPTLVDQDGIVGSAYGLRGVPATFVVDRQGNIRSVTTGYTSELGLRLRLWWANR